MPHLKSENINVCEPHTSLISNLPYNMPLALQYYGAAVTHLASCSVSLSIAKTTLEIEVPGSCTRDQLSRAINNERLFITDGVSDTRSGIAEKARACRNA